jgi:hypothetical protein
MTALNFDSYEKRISVGTNAYQPLLSTGLNLSHAVADQFRLAGDEGVVFVET